MVRYVCNWRMEHERQNGGLCADDIAYLLAEVRRLRAEAAAVRAWRSEDAPAYGQVRVPDVEMPKLHMVVYDVVEESE